MFGNQRPEARLLDRQQEMTAALEAATPGRRSRDRSRVLLTAHGKPTGHGRQGSYYGMKQGTFKPAMRLPTRSTRIRSRITTAIAAFILLFAGTLNASAQTYKPGDRVECDLTQIGSFMKGTVLPYLESDEPVFQGKYYLTRVFIEKYKTSYPEGVLCQTNWMRPLKEAPPNPPRGQNNGRNNGQDNGQNNGNDRRGNQPAANEPGAKFQPGDRVECDTTNIGNWYKGTVLPFKENDNPDLEKDKSGKYFYIHRVRLDNEASTRPAGGMCFTDRTRLLAGDAARPLPVDRSVGEVTVDRDNTLSADRPVLDCPVEQTPVRNGARPNVELLKKITRCDKGETPASKGYDGAVTVDVTAVQIAAPRQWIYDRDISGKPGTVIYPVRVTYTVKTFYRNRTLVEENWVRTINFYVNDFGEWQSGSEEPIRSPKSKEIPRLP